MQDIQTMFERFYQKHYNNLPNWVDKDLFKKTMEEKYISAITEARAQRKEKIPGGNLLHPLISNAIDMGSFAEVDNYAFYFDNPEQMIQTGYYPLFLQMQQPWYDLICNESKYVVGLLGSVGDYDKVLGENIAIISYGNSCSILTACVIDINHYPDLDSYLNEHWCSAAPQADSLEEAKQLYLNIKDEDDVQIFSEQRVRDKGGIHALELELTNEI